MREQDLFIETVIEAINDVRTAKGKREPWPRDKAYSLASVIMRRLLAKGWQFSPPLRPMVGGVLQGARRRD